MLTHKKEGKTMCGMRAFRFLFTFALALLPVLALAQGNGAVTPIPAVASSDGLITVTVPADAVKTTSPVYLAWDVADKGENIGDWAKSETIGEVTVAGAKIEVSGAGLGVPYGAKIRAFVMAKLPCSIFESMTKKAKAQSVVDTGYFPSAQTTKVELDFSLEDGADSGNWLLGSVLAHSGNKVTRIGATRDGSTASTLYCFGHNNVAAAISSAITGISNTSRGVMTLEMGSQASWWKSGSTTKNGTGTALVALNTTLPCPLFVFGGSYKSEGSSTVTTNVFGHGVLTVYGLKIYESQKVWDYVPARLDGAVGFYEKISEKFYPAVGEGAAMGYTMGGVAEEIAIPGEPIPSAVATYDLPSPEVDSAKNTITVVIPAGVVDMPERVRFAWDETDKGAEPDDWAHVVDLGSVDAQGRVFTFKGSEYKIPSGAKIRAFVTTEHIDLYAALTKPAATMGVVNTGYIPGPLTKKVELDFSLTDAGENGNWLLGSVLAHSSGKVTRIGATRDGSTASTLYCFGHNKVESSVSSELANITSSSRGVMTLEMGSQASWKSETATKKGTTALHASLDTTLPCPLFVFGGSYKSEGSSTVTTNVFGHGVLTVYGLKIYESQQVADYVPAEKGGRKGLYNTVGQTFHPTTVESTTVETDFAFVGGVTNSLPSVSIASSASRYIASGLLIFLK